MNTWDVLHTYPHDYKVIFVGDASMSPYEITYEGGSVEHWNEEAGALWLKRVTDIYESCIWLNPMAERYWEHIAIVPNHQADFRRPHVPADTGRPRHRHARVKPGVGNTWSQGKVANPDMRNAGRSISSGPYSS